MDVGNTPYTLVSPILKRLNAKQLSTLEENSPTLMPESDEVWALLIEKDFADRPYESGIKRQLLTPQSSSMPNRALYHRYSQERELFRDTSARRLRKLTEKLQREKSKNSIVPIEGIIREPIRRRTSNPRRGTPLWGSSGKPKSILGKAMKDMQHRLLMFGAGQKPSFHSTNAGPFQRQKSPSTIPSRPPRPPRQTQLPPQRTQSPVMAPKALIPPQQQPQPGNVSPERPPDTRKRKTQYPIFMPQKRPQTALPPVSREPVHSHTRKQPEHKSSLQRKVRSSLFH